ncbi:hypothetical protein WMY93_023223 [Mugilogobius chulae]|uniref:EF-hand domain-containing protein n=1 Tax=Mugilogobius chulae TaxID=88201 RepID=A0AAW0N836_9GOBI
MLVPDSSLQLIYICSPGEGRGEATIPPRSPLSRWSLLLAPVTGSASSSTAQICDAADMAKFLTQDQINDFKECFSLYDRQRNGRIQASDLMLVMRCLGSSPTPNEVQRHLLCHNTERGGELDFSTFLSIMH